MSFDVARLTSDESFWDSVSVWLSVAVAIGVSMEAVTEFDVLAGWLRLDTLERFSLRHGIAKAGLLLLIIALAFEVVAAVRTHNISEQIIAGLNGEIKEAQQREQNLIDETKALRVDNNRLQGAFSEQEETLKSLGERNTVFEKTAEDLKARNGRLLSEIRADNARVESARDEIVHGAEKVSGSVAEVRKAEADLVGAVKTIDDLHAQLRDLTTPRILSEAQVADLKNILKALPSTSFDISANHDAESVAFAKQIALMLKDANWDWKSKDGLDSLHFDGLPAIGGVVWKGLQVDICSQDNLVEFDKPVLALMNALSADGFPVLSYLNSEEESKSHREPCGMLHIVIGSKS